MEPQIRFQGLSVNPGHVTLGGCEIGIPEHPREHDHATMDLDPGRLRGRLR
ncbi:hypothetical protein BH23PLA1_BH23PLA1_35470 [soil metagenome]